MSHTPGPWEIKDHPTETTQIVGPNSMRVADVWCTDLPGGMENARLIAAAPDLLAAAIRAAFVLSNPARIERDCGDAQAFLRAAIAKAEGRTDG